MVTRYFVFYRKQSQKEDMWPFVKKTIEENFPSLLNQDSITVKVTSDNKSVVRFSVDLENRNEYSFGTLYDLTLRTHNLTL